MCKKIKINIRENVKSLEIFRVYIYSLTEFYVAEDYMKSQILGIT